MSILDNKTTEFQVFIEEIATETGIKMSIFSISGEYIAGENTILDTTDVAVVKQINGNTLFTIKIRNKDYIAKIKGDDKPEKNYAFLIKAFAYSYFSKEVDLTKQEFIKSLMFNEISIAQSQRYIVKYAIKKSPCFVMIITTNKNKIKEESDFIKTYDEDEEYIVPLYEDSLAIIKFIDGVVEYKSSEEYVEVLYQSLTEELGFEGKIYVGGTVKSIFEVTQSYQQALTAMRMSKALSSKGDIHTYQEYILTRMLEDLPKHKLTEYLNVLLDNNARKIFKDDEMINTAEEFLENSLNTSETSRKLYLHRNTLSYRLEKIQNETGLDVRKFSDAVTFRLITILLKLTK